MFWAALADSIPLYPLYALLFADAGLSTAEISSLFLIWSVVAIVAEIPSGALADRYSRRASLVAAGVLQAGGYLLWTVAPGYPGFAAGFVLWGLGGAFGSGALEALLYDGLASVGAEDHYARVQGRVSAASLLGQLPSAGAAAVLVATGGFVLVGWASVACCLGASLVAARLPDRRPPAPVEADPSGIPGTGAGGYLATLRSGLTDVVASPGVRAAVVAVAVLTGLDAMDEYFPLLARQWGVPVNAVPLALLSIPLVGAAGAAIGGAVRGVGPRALGALVALAVALFLGGAVIHRPLGVAGIALAYGVYQAVLVIADAALQSRITGPARATVTSAASVGAELVAIALYAAWALGAPAMVALVALAVAASLPRLLRPESAPVERAG